MDVGRRKDGRSAKRLRSIASVSMIAASVLFCLASFSDATSAAAPRRACNITVDTEPLVLTCPQDGLGPGRRSVVSGFEMAHYGSPLPIGRDCRDPDSMVSVKWPTNGDPAACSWEGLRNYLFSLCWQKESCVLDTPARAFGHLRPCPETKAMVVAAVASCVETDVKTTDVKVSPVQLPPTRPQGARVPAVGAGDDAAAPPASLPSDRANEAARTSIPTATATSSGPAALPTARDAATGPPASPSAPAAAASAALPQAPTPTPGLSPVGRPNTGPQSTEPVQPPPDSHRRPVPNPVQPPPPATPRATDDKPFPAPASVPPGPPFARAVQSGDVNVVCREVVEDRLLYLTCPNGQVITSVPFASYGSPRGQCDNPEALGINWNCHYQLTKAVVEQSCLGLSKCMLSTKDPLFQEAKACELVPQRRLVVTATCGPANTHPETAPAPDFELIGRPLSLARTRAGVVFGGISPQRSDVTYTMWIKPLVGIRGDPLPHNGQSAIFSWIEVVGNTTHRRGPGLVIDSRKAGKLTMQFRLNLPDGRQVQVHNTRALEANAWSHWAFVVTDAQVVWYCNGRRLSAQNVANHPRSSSPVNATLVIGGNRFRHGAEALVDKFRFHQRVLDAAEVAAEFESFHPTGELDIPARILRARADALVAAQEQALQDKLDALGPSEYDEDVDEDDGEEAGEAEADEEGAAGEAGDLLAVGPLLQGDAGFVGPEALSPADLVELGLNYQLGEDDLARDFGLALSLFNTAAEMDGNGRAHFYLGLSHGLGLGTVRNRTKAMLHYTLGAIEGNHAAILALGVAYERLNQLEVAVYHYERLEVEVKRQLRSKERPYVDEIILSEGKFVGRTGEDDAAIQWYEARAAAGHADAAAHLANLHHTGRHGIERDLGAAVEGYRRAIELGNRQAMYNLGVAYNHGQGVEKNVSMAFHWYNQSAALGFGPAYNGLGAMYSSGRGVEKNHTKAFELFQKAADAGSRDALFNVALYYRQGWGNVTKDLAKAHKHTEKAAERGHAESMGIVGRAYLHGDNGAGNRSFEHAHAYLKAMAQRGAWGGVLREGFDLYLGADDDTALVRYLHGAELGYDSAEENVAWLLEQGALPRDERGIGGLGLGAGDGSTESGNPQDEAALEAFSLEQQYEYYALLAAKDYMFALLKVGDAHYYGRGVRRDIRAARRHYARASFLGSAQGTYNLAYMNHVGEGGLSRDLWAAHLLYVESIMQSEDAIIPSSLMIVRLMAEIAWEWALATLDAAGLARDTQAILALTVLLLWLVGLRSVILSCWDARAGDGGDDENIEDVEFVDGQ